MVDEEIISVEESQLDKAINKGKRNMFIHFLYYPYFDALYDIYLASSYNIS